MKLSKVDKQILESYTYMLEGLADYLGPGYEFVLHSLENLDRSVIKIINGFHSGRTEGAPITDLALKMLQQIQENDCAHQHHTYFNYSHEGVPLKSTTISILGENERIIGLLCINFYLSTPLSAIVESLSDTHTRSARSDETFSSSLDDLISSVLDDAVKQVYANGAITSTNRNKEIISILYEKGIFNMKDAVNHVSQKMGISKNTVYMHLRALNQAGSNKA